MSDEALLIAGFSGRALAASARRAGYTPLVLDAFGDTDTRSLSGGLETMPEAFVHGFPTRSTIAALDRLTAASGKKTVGLVLGAGFEERPALVARLAERFSLIGCGADAVAASKDPARFFPLLRDLGISHPETLIDPPADGAGWLTKRIGASGGTHIARCRHRVTGLKNRYFQREVAGEPLSMLGVIGRRGMAFAFTRQWSSPMPRRPYRYGGCSGQIDLDSDLEARLIEIGVDLSKALGLIGLVSFDFLLNPDAGPLLLEVNPRPGASLDVLDDRHGTLLEAHLAASRGDDPAALLADRWRPLPRAAAYFYADEGALPVPLIDWPEWTADRPAAGAAIQCNAPIVTVISEAATSTEAERLLAERLGLVGTLLYAHPKNGKETP